MKFIRINSTIVFALLIILIPHQPSNAQPGRDVVELFEVVGERAGSMLGYKVTGLGDQNGDGFDDILASAPGDRKVFMYFGGNPMDTIPDMVFHEGSDDGFGFCICNLGDINGNSFNDFAIGSGSKVRVYWGGSELDTISDLSLPRAFQICSAGDVNGDGFLDILHSNATWHSYQGKVSLYLGGAEPDSIADWSVLGDSSWWYFGDKISGDGDMNGDSYDDIAISGFRYVNALTYSYIKIFYGGADMDTVPALIMDSFVQSLDITTTSAIIDLNSDGLFDLCVDAKSDTAASVFFSPILPDIIPDLTLNGSSLSGKMWEISEAGDVNYDGHSDIIIGNYDGWNSLGEVLIFLGGPYMDGEFDIGFTGFYGPYEGAGRSVGRAGDVNGDGVDDILFGALPYPGTDRHGKVMIFSGDSTLTSVPSIPGDSSNRLSSFSLRQNYPNPFNSSTEIGYRILGNHPTRVLIKVYNILGEEVVTLVDGFQGPGLYRVTWNGRDKKGTDVSSGIYFSQLQTGSYRQTIKMLLLR